MNSIILKLRGLNPKWTVFISIAVPLVVTIASIGSDENFCFAGILTVIASVLLYTTLAVHAIEKDEKAILVSYFVIAAYIVSAVMTFNTFEDTPGFRTAITDEICNFRNPIESLNKFAASTVINNAPYSFLMNVIMVVAWSVGLKHINKKYLLTWITGLACNIILGFGNLFVLTDDIQGYDTYKICSNLCGAITIVFFISILCVKDSKKKPNGKENEALDIPHPQKIVETSTESSKRNQLFKLKELLDSGLLTQAEFDIEKKKILNS